jgi:hypothetical protein
MKKVRERPKPMKQSYEIASIQRTEPPPNTEGANWYQYVISFEGVDVIHGCRKGSLKAVTSAVEEIIVQLNERHSKKRGREKKS